MKKSASIILLLVACVLYGQGVMFQKIVLDPGHGGPKLNHDGIGAPGMNGNDKPNEADINLNVANTLSSMLQNQLATVIMTRNADIEVTRAARAAKIIFERPNAAVSIHFNSNDAPFWQATETQFHPGHWINYSLAYAIHNRMLGLGYSDWGNVSRSDLEVLNRVNTYNSSNPALVPIPMCLVEPLYISNSDGWNKMTFGSGIIGAQQVATFINNGLIDFFDNNYTTRPKVIFRYIFNNKGYLTFNYDIYGINSTLLKTYFLYSSDDPTLPIESWQLEFSGIATSWQTPVDGCKKYYKLKAVVDNTPYLSETFGISKQNCTSSYNYISILSVEGNITSGDDVTYASNLMTIYPQITAVSKWNAQTNDWNTATMTESGVINDFQIFENLAYRILSNNDFEFQCWGYYDYPLSKPFITAQQALTVNQNTSFNILPSNLTITGGTNPAEYCVIILPGSNYTVSNNSIIPAQNFTGNLNVNLRVTDNSGWSDPYSFAVTVLLASSVEENGVFTTELNQAYPNPFNNSTMISYQLSAETIINLAVYNNKGELVKTLFVGHQKAGQYQVEFNADGLNSGLYICKMIMVDKTLPVKCC